MTATEMEDAELYKINIVEASNDAQNEDTRKNIAIIKDDFKLPKHFTYKNLRSYSSKAQTENGTAKSSKCDYTYDNDDEFQDAIAGIEVSEMQSIVPITIQQPDADFDAQKFFVNEEVVDTNFEEKTVQNTENFIPHKDIAAALMPKKSTACSFQEFSKLNVNDKLNNLFIQQETLIINQCKANVKYSQQPISSNNLYIEETIKLQAILPIETLKQFIIFDANLEKNPEFRKKIVMHLGPTTVSNDWKATIRFTLKALMKNELQILYSYLGQKGKKNFSKTFTCKIITTFVRNCEKAPATKELNSYLSNYLKQAAVRLQGYKSRRKVDDNQETTAATVRTGDESNSDG